MGHAEIHAPENERLAQSGLPLAEDEPTFVSIPADLFAKLHRTTAERDANPQLTGKADYPTHKLRSRMRDYIATLVSLPPGAFELTVPTGGGKTFAEPRGGR